MAYTCSKDASHQSTDSDYCSICGAKIVGAASLLGASSPAAAPTMQSTASVTAPAGGAEICPDCGTPRHPGARFCEICRYNFDSRTSGGGAPSPPIAAQAPPFVASPATPAVIDQPAPTPLAVTPSVDTPLPVMPAPAVDFAPISTAATAPAALPVGLLKWEAVVIVDPDLYTEPDPDLPLPQGEPERVFPLDFAENLLGRRSDRKDIHPEIPVGDPGVSHRHAKFLRQPDGSFQLLDVGSTNGTRLNGVEVKPGVRTPLQVGDQITVGCWTRITIRLSA